MTSPLSRPHPTLPVRPHASAPSSEVVVVVTKSTKINALHTVVMAKADSGGREGLGSPFQRTGAEGQRHLADCQAEHRWAEHGGKKNQWFSVLFLRELELNNRLNETV